MKALLGYSLKRILLMVPTLFGITLVTFLLLSFAPADRAEIELQRVNEQTQFKDSAAREQAVTELRVRHGLIDPTTHERFTWPERYWQWLQRAASLRLAGPEEDDHAFHKRILDALPVTLLLGFWALVCAFGIGIPLGAWLGMRAGSQQDRLVSGGLFVALGVPEFLLATLLVLGFAGPWLNVFPSAGLRTDGASSWSVVRQFVDLGWHLVLPVGAMALGPTVLVARFLRESVSRAAGQTFAVNLRAWGTEPRLVRQRLLRVGSAPLATLAGSLLPMLVGGSVVVESVFSLNGLGRLAYDAARSQQEGMVLALTLLASTVTLAAMLLSDLLQRLFDPRVRVIG